MKRTLFAWAIIPLLTLVAVLAAGGSEWTDPVPYGPYDLDYPAYFGNRISIPDDNQTTKQGVYLGRMLFYETALSVNNKVSCATCHQQKLAFTDGKILSSGVTNVPTLRNSMSLANLLWVRSFFWDGRAKSLEEQGKIPITHPDEMGESLEYASLKLQQIKRYPPLFKLVFGSDTVTGDRIVKAIAQFERTLISSNSRYDKHLQHSYTLTAEEERGLDLFMTNPSIPNGVRGGNCAFCHGTPKMFMELFHNNGLDSVPQDIGREQHTGLPNDHGRFRVVTLRNIAVTAPYMHDGRFKTLEEVLDHYSEHIQPSATLSQFLKNKSNEPGGRTLKLTAQEKKDIIHFLRTLTDSSFLTDARFSNPHFASMKKIK